MGWTITIGRVVGTEIKVHLTFFILVAFWAMAGYQVGGPPGALAGCAGVDAAKQPAWQAGRFGGPAGSNAACTRWANRTSFSRRTWFARTSS